MGRNLSRRTTAMPVAAPRVIHYVDPAPQRELILHTAAEVAAYREQQRRLVARARRRHAAIAARDRKVRRFWIGFGAVFALAVLVTVVVAGWLIWSVMGLGVLAIPVLIVGVTGLAVGGHRCITIVQHSHR